MTRLSSSAGAPARDLRSLQQAICDRARDFEIGPLLDLLATMGYQPAEIYFRAHLTEAPQPTLLHHIEFTDAEGTLAGPALRSGPSVELGSIPELAAETAPAADARHGRPKPPPVVEAFRAGGPRSQVTITVNLGLLSCRSPLPSYFQHLLGDLAIREPLVELLQILDRSLLHARLTCERPERLVDQWGQIRSDLLRIHGLDSLVGLSWLFRHVFPELAAKVERAAERLRVPYASARLNYAHLGSASFGALTRIAVHDFQVTLRCEESLLRPGVPWVHEADRRLRTILFPALGPVCLNLTVILELEDDRASAALSDGSGSPPDSYLGMAPLGQPGAGDLPIRKVVLYRGLLPRNGIELDELERALADGARVTPSGLGLREPDGERALDLAIELDGRRRRYAATVRWGARAWFRDEPYAIELRGEHLDPAAPTAREHPRLWSLLRDRARRDLAAGLAAATLAHYDTNTVTDDMVADLLARSQDDALHALLTYGGATEVTPAAWERFLQSQQR